MLCFDPMIDLAEDVAATASLSRLLAADTLTRKWRHKFVRATRRRFGDDDKVEEALGCPWCLSLYAALVVRILRRLPGGPLIVRLLAVRWLAAAARLQLEANVRDWPDDVPYMGGAPDPSALTETQLRRQILRLGSKVESLSDHRIMDSLKASLMELEARNGNRP